VVGRDHLTPTRWQDLFCGHVSDAPVYDEAGRLVAIVGISYDIIERKEAEAKQALLVRELHHRVKNTLTTVQAIMGSTPRATETTEDFQRAFTARIASLARTHSLLTEAKWQSVAFGDLLRAELEPYDDGSEHRITLAGPPVELSSELAVPIGMAVHELTTNAALELDLPLLWCEQADTLEHASHLALISAVSLPAVRN
jgi:hypothetical protein